MKDSSPTVTDKKKPPTARNPFELPREFCPIWPKACSETVSVFTDETEHALSPRLRADHSPYRYQELGRCAHNRNRMKIHLANQIVLC